MYDEENGLLYLYANGDWYVGNKRGIRDTSNITVTGGQRTGACIISKNKFSYGSFECSIKLPAFDGICTSMWLFNYVKSEETGVPDANYEIDIEVHGTTTLSSNSGNMSRPLFTSWLTEDSNRSEYKDAGCNLADGQFHTLRFDWHTDRIDYYIDGVLLCTQTTHVPDTEMQLNIGCWFPKNWCGDPCFETDYAVVRSFNYHPFAGEVAKKTDSESNKQKGTWTDGYAEDCDLVANFDFNYDIAANNAWQVTGTSTQDTAAGTITVNGTLTQNVTMDCLGNAYTLNVLADGGTVRVSYASIVDGVSVSGYEEVAVTGGIGTVNFTTPANCTRLVIEITGTDITVDKVTLAVNAA